MTVFRYKAVNEKGKSHKGLMEGDSPAQVRVLLKSHGLILTDIEPVSDSKAATSSQVRGGGGTFSFRRKRVPASQLAAMTYQFSTLLSAGLTVEAAVANMAAETDNMVLKQALLSARGKVLEGHSLASGLQDFPSIFPQLYTASVAVGEKTGQLEQVLLRLADYYEKQRSAQEKITTALIYPILLTLVSSTVVIFLMVYVIPQITNVFIQTGQALPEVTLILLGISAFLRAYGLYFLLFLIALVMLFRYSLRYPPFLLRVHRMLLGTPVIGNTVVAINASRFSRTFGILFSAGVPVIDAMVSANSIIGVIPIHESIREAIVKVGEGSSIHQALQHTGYFSSLTIQLISSGESSGRLESMLEKAAAFQEQNTAHKLDTALALFEPVLILTMGSIVLFIVLAVLLPIFQMNQLNQ